MRVELNSALAKKLHWVKVSTPGARMEGNFPDFMIVGPQRTGTTWLSANLRYHPEIFLSYPKELYFFNRLQQEGCGYSLHWEKFGWHVVSRGARALMRELVKIWFMDVYKTGRLRADELEWYLRFFEDDDFVTATIKRLEGEHTGGGSGEPRVRGEATASYAVLDPDIIREIVTINPDLKVVLMVRDPVERAWSHAKKDLIRDGGRSLSSIPVQVIVDYLSDEYLVKCGFYTKAIANWRGFLKPEHLFIGSYSDIEARGAELLTDIFGFLGVEQNDRYINPRSRTVINKTSDLEMPAECRAFLQEIYAEEMARLRSVESVGSV